MLIVKKFGGSSVANRDRVFNVARRIGKEYDKGNRVVVVLSAQGDTTDEMVALAKSYSPMPSKREMDMLITTGEQISVSLMALALHELGYNAISLNASQVGMYTTTVYGNARLKDISAERITNELDRNNIVLVTGFQGINRYEDVTTLGRGGSDTTAVALAAALNADRCEIYTDVEGIYTADPRVVPNARKLEEITYDEMLELASLGAKVLHNRSVEMAKKYDVELVVRSSMTEAEGTIVKEELTVEKMLVSGVAADKDIARIAIMDIEDHPGMAFKIFNLLAKENINVDIILQSIGHHETRDISFTVDLEDAGRTEQILLNHQESLKFSGVSVDTTVAKVSLVGAGMQSNAGVASKMFEAMYDAGINIKMISTSEIKISLLIDEKYVDEAVVAIHEEFALGR